VEGWGGGQKKTINSEIGEKCQAEWEGCGRSEGRRTGGEAPGEVGQIKETENKANASSK